MSTSTDSGERHIRQNIALKCVDGDAQFPCNAYSGTIDQATEFVTDGWVCSGDSGSGAFDYVDLDGHLLVDYGRSVTMFRASGPVLIG